MSEHSGSKYIKWIKARFPDEAETRVDVYNVLMAFGVTCPARQHAIKKLLCAGLRGKNTEIKDLEEARDAISRAIEINRQERADEDP